MRKRPEGLIKSERGWSWDLTHYQLTRVAFDYAVSLQFVSESAYSMEIRIEGDFQVSQRLRSQVFVSTSDRQAAYVSLVSALHQAGGRLEIADTGELQVAIGDVMQIDVFSSDEFETWSLGDSDGVMMVAGVGEQLHIWGLDNE